MAALKTTRSKNSSTRKLMHQKQYRRKANMLKKASEYSKMCDADVCVGIRMRETGQVHILSADSSGFWAFLTSQLSSHYPTPTVMTDRDLEKTREETVFREQQ
ncbi:uncharacterized protein N7515_007519 [Penicillium bovifimosum]|uniref:MADS-box domain-containing protein n=1 Tax=Penicillium bovifimosum TaxID=126998 RepID=A0A9W9L274_9EURO|nr:uncharacterized protein N7515_007519 [Penicillium bovifimosum]KAJ5131480.1 hypothetical protein N7515_007519 [Penicillium bovifimosum]